jgi:Protein of unknown function (DUF3124)
MTSRDGAMRRIVGTAALLFAASALLTHATAQTVDLPPAIRASAAALAPAPGNLQRAGSVYVATYSRLPFGGGSVEMDLSVTLSIRNVSPDRVLVLRAIDYYDTAGERLQAYLPAPIGLRPFGTIDLFLQARDRRGGSGGNFQVDWAGVAGTPEPLIEAIMLGEVGNRSFSFVSRGREIDQRN